MTLNLQSSNAAGLPVRAAVEFKVPAGACDCHVHVFDPVEFPYASNRIYTPPRASIEDLRNLQTALGLERLIVVAPSVYARDNSCTIDAVRKFGPARARGIVVIDASITTDELDDLAAAGVCGVRLNLESAGDTEAAPARRTLMSLAERIQGRDWHIQFDTRLSVIQALKRELAELPMPIVFSHFGRARAALGPEQPGFADLLDLVASGSAYVKISAPYRISDRSPDFPDAKPFAQALVAANPDRILWASNWPHPGRAPKSTMIAAPYPNDDGCVLNLLPSWVPDAIIRKKILVENPATLYRFVPR